MSRRILVVEDEPGILNLVGQVLDEEGYDVTRAANGAVALDILSASAAFDLAVIDMWMPVLNGWEFAAALVERGVRLPLLIMTAASDARAYAVEVGAVGFIGKPFSVDNLVLAVRDAMPPIDGRPGGNVSPDSPPDITPRPTIGSGHFKLAFR